MLSLIAASILAFQAPVVLFDQHFVIGELVNGAWKEPTDHLLNLPFPLPAKRLGIGKVQGDGRVAGIEKDDHFGTFYVKGDEAPTGPMMSGGSVAFPRPVEKLSNTSPVYLSIVRQYLARLGLKHAVPRITAVLSVDLDGDSTKEVLIEARNTDESDLSTAISGPPNHPGGDYSLVLLRSVGPHGKVKTTEIAANFKRRREQMLILTRIDAIADVDGDGKYEVLISWRHYEGSGAELYRFSKKGFKLLAGAGVDV